MAVVGSGSLLGVGAAIAIPSWIVYGLDRREEPGGVRIHVAPNGIGGSF